MTEGQKFIFKVGELEFEIDDLGRELNWTFATYYADAVGDLDEKDALYADFRKRYGWVSRNDGKIIFDYFKAHRNDWAAHEKYFNNYFALWSHFLKQGNLQGAEEIWRGVLNNATYWEGKFRSRIDKSFPYYCLGVTAIKAGNIDKGFLILHQALEEDMLTFGQSVTGTPAHRFVHLDFIGHFDPLSRETEELESYLTMFLQQYRKTRKFGRVRGGRLTIPKIKQRFLLDQGIRDTSFVFVYILAKLKSLLTEEYDVPRWWGAEIPADVRSNNLAYLLQTQLAFNLCLVIDSLIHRKNPGPKKMFSDHMEYMSGKLQLSLHQPYPPGKSQATRLKVLNPAFNASFDQTVIDILNGQFQNPGGNPLSAPEADIAIAYGFRNMAAHDIKAQPLLLPHVPEVYQRVMNVLFMTLEHL